MNVYLVVEGNRTEVAVYPEWIRLLNPSLTQIRYIEDFAENNFLVVSGGGVPHYFDTIRNGAEDVKANRTIDRLVVAVDSEEMTYQEKYDEIDAVLSPVAAGIDYMIVIQHFCIETWALANSLLLSTRNIRDDTLRSYRRFFDVSVQDPELLPAYAPEGLSRVAFAYKYLRTAIRHKYRGSYTKGDPAVIADPRYFSRVRQRHLDNAHIPSFSHFLSAFS